MPSQNQASITSSGSGTSQPSNSTPKEATPSNDKIVKDGWGSKANFQASYGLKMDPNGIEEGNAILRGYREMDERNAESAREGGSGR